MAGRFSYSSPGGRLQRPWFRIGDLDVGTAVFVALLCIASMVIYAVEPAGKPILTRLALIPSEVRGLELWRLVTWPLANGLSQQLLWVAIDIALLWYIGNMLESIIGRVRMATLLLSVTVVSGLIGTLLDLPQAGISAIEFVVLLLFIAEHPNARFFFGIPGWVLGAAFVALQVLQLLGDGRTEELLFFLCTLVVGALAGRAVGLLGDYEFIPRVPLPAALNGVPRRRASRQNRGAPKRNHRGRVIDGPWTAPPAPSSPANVGTDRQAAQAELDALLDKISADGLDSLTADEKRRLNDLSKRLR